MNDNWVVEVTFIDDGFERSDKSVILYTIEIDVKRLKVTVIDLTIWILKGKGVGIGTDMECLEHGILKQRTIVMMHKDTVGPFAEKLDNLYILLVGIFVGRISNITYQHVLCRMFAPQRQVFFIHEVIGINGLVGCIVIDLIVGEYQ